MTLLRRWLVAVVLALGFAAYASPGEAAMSVCNRTSYVLYTAVGAASSVDISTQGWSRIAPGGCRVLLKNDLIGPGYYVYARTSQAHTGPARAWGGAMGLCVKDTNFTSRDALTARYCQSDDFFQLPFAQVDTHHLRSWTMTFSESSLLKSLAQAQLAGLKRLLRDVGFKIAVIDGRPDPATDKAIAEFRKRLRLAPTASIGDLFDALETDALKTSSPAGFSQIAGISWGGCRGRDGFPICGGRNSGRGPRILPRETHPPGGSEFFGVVAHERVDLGALTLRQ